MANIDDILNQYGKEISEETHEYSNALQANMTRDSVRRPWSPPDQEGGTQNQSSPSSDSIEGLWYASPQSIAETIRKHAKILLPVLGTSLLLAIAAARYFPTTFNSSLHLYAPEKTDSISSRLSLFSNRVEFASFPVDFKVPLGLIARRLRGEVARTWVLKQYAAKPHLTDVEVIPASVKAETFHTDGTELLVIQAYANDPKIASDVAYLYRDYLENEVNVMRLDHLEKIHQWVEMTGQGLQRSLDDVTSELQKLAEGALSNSDVQLNNKLADAFSESEIRRIKAQKEIEDLQSASVSHSFDKIWGIADPAIQDLRQVDQALQTSQLADPPEVVKARREEVRAKALTLVDTLLRDKKIENAALQQQSKKLKAQVTSHEMIGVSEHQRDLIRQQSEYQGLIGELARLREQIRVERDLKVSHLTVVQQALPDPTTRRPLFLVKYGFCVLASLFFTLIVLMLLEWSEAGLRLKSKRPQDGMGSRSRSPLGQPVSELGA
jgi:hypothetical protein